MSNKFEFLTDKGFDFNNSNFCKYWSIKTRIEFLQRKILVSCIFYYELDDTILTDNEYNIISQQLIDLMSKTDKSIVEKTKYYYVFKDFDKSTGFDLYSKLNKVDKQHLQEFTGYLIVCGKKRK